MTYAVWTTKYDDPSPVLRRLEALEGRMDALEGGGRPEPPDRAAVYDLQNRIDEVYSLIDGHAARNRAKMDEIVEGIDSIHDYLNKILDEFRRPGYEPSVKRGDWR